MRARLAIAAPILFLSLASAAADPITVTVTGVVAPVVPQSPNGPYGFDYGGYFGPAGASLAGDPFTVVWTVIDCKCSGSTSFNPIIDAVLTINGMSYDFGAGAGPGNDSRSDLPEYQVVVDISRPPSHISLTTHDYIFGPLQNNPSLDGGFYLHNGTQAFLILDPPAPAPGPIAGAGLPGVILAAGALWLKRKARR